MSHGKLAADLDISEATQEKYIITLHKNRRDTNERKDAAIIGYPYWGYKIKSILGKASILLGLLLLCTFFSFTARISLHRKTC